MTNTALVAGYPSSEGNAVETVRALTRRFSGTVVWVDAPPAAYLRAIGFGDEQLERIRPVAKTDPRTLWDFATASAVFFTHGLYGDPGVDPRKLTVNLWHGAGMKRSKSLFPDRSLRSKPSDVIVGGSALWGHYTAALSGLRPDETILSGYPRNDQFFRDLDDQQLTAIGIDPLAPFVVWLPSYRTARDAGTMAAFSDSASIHVDAALADRFAAVVRVLSVQGVQVVVKPHPLDAVARDIRGGITVSDTELLDAGVPLYSLLGRSSGLITDTSSVCIDYLVTDKPIGYFFPDRADYAAGRGFFPADMLDRLPGPLLDTADDFAAFARDVIDGGTGCRDRRAALRRSGGVVQTQTAADRLLDALSSGSTDFATALRHGRTGSGALPRGDSDTR
ncbi:CDP-glycerol glycerophosphotransferase family protein [Flexivirga sp. B27]